MKISELNQKPGIDKNIKPEETYLQFEKLLIELRKNELPDGIVISINKDIADLNLISSFGGELRKIIK